MSILNPKSDMEVIEAALLENISGGAFECCATGGGTGGGTGGDTGGGGGGGGGDPVENQLT